MIKVYYLIQPSFTFRKKFNILLFIIHCLQYHSQIFSMIIFITQIHQNIINKYTCTTPLTQQILNPWKRTLVLDNNLVQLSIINIQSIRIHSFPHKYTDISQDEILGRMNLLLTKSCNYTFKSFNFEGNHPIGCLRNKSTSRNLNL